MFKPFLAGLLAVFCGLALADGATFITPGPALQDGPMRQDLMKPRANVVQLHAVTINRAAFDAKVLTVDMGKYHYRFVGGPVKAAVPGYEAWYGTDGNPLNGGASLGISREIGDTTALLGVMHALGHDFQLSSNKAGSWVLELDNSSGMQMIGIDPSASAASAPRGKP